MEVWPDNNVVPWGLEFCHHSMLIENQNAVVAPKEAEADSCGTVLSSKQKASCSETKDRVEEGASPSLLLSLPIEIRLQIYAWLNLMNPVQHAQLASWYPTPVYIAYLVKAIVPDGEPCGTSADALASKIENTEPAESSETKPKGQRLLSPYRPLSSIPSAFLRANRQIYEEAKLLPFHENEFIFVNWFSSGIWAARAFIKALKPWQRESMRYARLELLAKDFTNSGLEEWYVLCGFWSSGLRGLRLKILNGPHALRSDPAALDRASPQMKALDLFDGQEKEWIENGLKKMSALKFLEVELAIHGWSKETQVAWCERLSRMLNAERGEEKTVSVVSVERDFECAKTKSEQGIISEKSA